MAQLPDRTLTTDKYDIRAKAGNPNDVEVWRRPYGQHTEWERIAS